MKSSVSSSAQANAIGLLDVVQKTAAWCIVFVAASFGSTQTAIATHLEPYACQPCSGGGHSTTSWRFRSETELPGYPLRGAVGQEEYDNDLESRTVLFGSDYLKELCIDIKEFQTEDGTDFLSFHQQQLTDGQPTASHSLSGDVVDSSDPPLRVCLNGGSDSLQRRAFYMDFITNGSNSDDGFELDDLSYCCFDSPDGSTESRALMHYQRNIGIWTGPNDVIHALTSLGDFAGLSVVLQPNGYLDRSSHTVYTRCGARPTTTNWDRKITVTGDNWFLIPEEECPYPNFLYLAFEGPYDGVFDLWLSPYTKSSRVETIRYMIHPSVDSIYHDDIETALRDSARILFAASEGAIQINEFIETDLGYQIIFHDAVGRSTAGSVIRMYRGTYYDDYSGKSLETYSPYTVAHEILHLLFDLPDEYTEPFGYYVADNTGGSAGPEGDYVIELDGVSHVVTDSDGTTDNSHRIASDLANAVNTGPLSNSVSATIGTNPTSQTVLLYFDDPFMSRSAKTVDDGGSITRSSAFYRPCDHTIMSSSRRSLNICNSSHLDHPSTNDGNHLKVSSNEIPQLVHSRFVDYWRNRYGSEHVSGWDILEQNGHVPYSINWTPSIHNFKYFDFNGKLGKVTPLP